MVTHPGPPQTRTCGITAYGSSGHGFATRPQAPRTPCSRRPPRNIRAPECRIVLESPPGSGTLSVEVSLRRFQDSVTLALFPSNGSMTRHPLSLHGVPWDGSPASQVLLRCYDALSPSRRASFPSLGSTADATAHWLPQGAVALCCGPGPLVTRCPAGIRPRRSQGSPRFLGEPRCVHALG